MDGRAGQPFALSRLEMTGWAAQEGRCDIISMWGLRPGGCGGWEMVCIGHTGWHSQCWSESDLALVAPRSVLSFCFCFSCWVVSEVRFRSKIKLALFMTCGFPPPHSPRVKSVSPVVASFAGERIPSPDCGSLGIPSRVPGFTEARTVTGVADQLFSPVNWPRAHMGSWPVISCVLLVSLLRKENTKPTLVTGGSCYFWVVFPDLAKSLLGMRRTVVDKAWWYSHLHLSSPCFLCFQRFIYRVLASLGLRCFAWAFSGCSGPGPALRCVPPASHCRGPSCCRRGLWAWAAVLAARGLSSCGAWAWLLRTTWDLPRSGIKSVTPALSGGILSAASPGKPYPLFLNKRQAVDTPLKRWPNFKAYLLDQKFGESSP